MWIPNTRTGWTLETIIISRVQGLGSMLSERGSSACNCSWIFLVCCCFFHGNKLMRLNFSLTASVHWGFLIVVFIVFSQSVSICLVPLCLCSQLCLCLFFLCQVCMSHAVLVSCFSLKVSCPVLHLVLLPLSLVWLRSCSIFVIASCVYLSTPSPPVLCYVIQSKDAVWQVECGPKCRTLQTNMNLKHSTGKHDKT